jgi:hypothetical protein
METYIGQCLWNMTQLISASGKTPDALILRAPAPPQSRRHHVRVPVLNWRRIGYGVRIAESRLRAYPVSPVIFPGEAANAAQKALSVDRFAPR